MNIGISAEQKDMEQRGTFEEMHRIPGVRPLQYLQGRVSWEAGALYH